MREGDEWRVSVYLWLSPANSYFAAGQFRTKTSRVAGSQAGLKSWTLGQEPPPWIPGHATRKRTTFNDGCVDGAGTVMIWSALTARVLSPFADAEFVRR